MNSTYHKPPGQSRCGIKNRNVLEFISEEWYAKGINETVKAMAVALAYYSAGAYYLPGYIMQAGGDGHGK